MVYHVLEYLEKTEMRLGNKIAFRDFMNEYTYTQLKYMSQAIGSYIARKGIVNSPIVLLMDKSVFTISGFLGCLYSHNFYVPVDVKMPAYRIQMIVDTMAPALLIFDEKNQNLAEKIYGNFKKVSFAECSSAEISVDIITDRRKEMIDTDPAYVLFTSGSTGVPKGVVIGQKSLVDYVERLCEELQFKESDVFGNQSPFYFDPSVIDIYCTIKMGATMCIIPPSFFTFPIKLLDFLEQNKITTIRWVPSALNIVAGCDGLSHKRPEFLKKIIFGSEVMPIKCFHYWKEHYPEVVFIQVYGPTEITGTCTYYIVPDDYNNEDYIPIGSAYYNTDVFLLNDEKKVTDENEIGEICVRGSCLALGYYGELEKSGKVFTQNPLNPYYRDLIYRTGDLARYNSHRELVFVSRKDYQIKHMGYRIELGEIEHSVYAVDGIKTACCVFDKETEKIGLYYVTDRVGREKLYNSLKEKLPRYMLPEEMIKLEKMPLTASGKMDRKYLLESFQIFLAGR